MIYKFLSILFFCGACVSAFGQELQSPQINQNAIFANPGLAGSKGQTRVCTTAGTVSTTIGNHTLESPQQTTTHSNFLVSADGLILNKSIGIGGYISNTNYSKSNIGFVGPNIPQNIDTLLYKSEISLRYSNISAGIIVAPKFYLYSNTSTDKSRFISPALSFGIRESTYDTSSDSAFLYSNAPSASYGHSDQSSYFSLNHISAGILYNTSKGYCGIKVSYLESSINRFDISGAFVCAHSFYNKKTSNPKFSFNPQLYLAFYLKTSEKHTNTIQAPYFVNQGVKCNVNLDIRYGKILFGTFLYAPKYIASSLGIMAGLQFASTRVVLNYMQSYVNLNNVGGLYLSVNILLKNKKTSKDSVNEN